MQSIFIFDLNNLGVVPVLVGPLQALLAILPALLVALGTVLISIFNPKAMWNFVQLLWRQKIALIIVVAAIWGVNEGFKRLFPNTEAVSTVDTSAATDWSMFRGGTSRRGSTMQGEDPGHGQVQWSFSDDGIKTFYSSPSMVGNRIYATSARWEFFKKDGAIYSLDAETGKLVWKFNEDGYRATFSSPSVSGKFLCVGEGLHLTKDARIFCIDIEASERERRGVKLWDFRTNSHVESSPCIADGKVFCGAGADGLYCLELEPKGGEANVLWHLEEKDAPDCESSPVYHDGHVYVGLGIGGNGVLCVEANTGKIKWKLKTPYPVFGSPSIHDGQLFVGMGHGDFINKAEVVKNLTAEKMKKAGKSAEEIEAATKDIRPVGEVWCVDLQSQEKKWSYEVGRTVLGSVAIADDKLYFGSRDKHFYCLDMNGKLVKKWNAKAPIITSPAVGKKLVYTVPEAGRLVGLDKDKLKPLWEVNLNSPLSISSPLVGNGSIIVGTNTQGLLKIGKPGFEKVEPLWQGERGVIGSSGANDGSLIPERGKYAWAFKGMGEEVAKTTAPLMYLSDAFYFDTADTERRGLVKVQTNEKKSKPKATWFAPSDHPVSIAAAGTKGVIYFVDGTASDSGRFLRAVSAETGKEMDRFAIKDGSGKFMITDSHLIINDEKSGIRLLDISTPDKLKEVWQWQGGDIQGTPLINGNFVTVLLKDKPSIVVLDAIDGVALWNKELPSAINGDPIFAADKVWVAFEDGVAAYSMVDDADYLRIQDDIPRSPLVYNGDRIGFVSTTGKVVLVDAFNGAVIKRIPGALGNFPPLLTDDALLYVAEGQLTYHDLTSGEEHQWTKIKAKWPGNVASDMVMLDSRIYFATETRGMVCMKAK